MSIPNGPYLSWEKEIVDLDNKIQDLASTSDFSKSDLEGLQRKRNEKLVKSYKKLTAWNKVELARRSGRPYSLDYYSNVFSEFTELHGDRCFGDDPSIVGGFAKIDGQKVMLIGQQKGKDTKEIVYRNFGMPHPEGYRKALRLMEMAEKFNAPVICFIDTPGAFPGLGAEERGQAEAIARNLREMAVLKVPMIVVIIGEGASGGALGIGMGDHIMMLENAWYTVISPEGCAAILWGDRAKAQEMADKMKLTAEDLIELNVIDEIIAEPIGGAHWDPQTVYDNLSKSLISKLSELKKMETSELVSARIEKYAAMGRYSEN